jgi:hypothetical protein
MKKIDANKWLTVAVVVACTIAARSCSAEGLFNHEGTVREGVSPGLQYYSGSDGEHGWQSDTGGVSYFHGSKRSCTTQRVLGNSRTSCVEW